MKFYRGIKIADEYYTLLFGKQKDGGQIVIADNYPYCIMPYEEVQNGQIVNISTNPKYIAKKVEKYSKIAEQKIKDKYHEAIQYGVFPLDETYYANMAWFATWQRVINLYNSSIASSFPVNFNVRLYTKVDDKYINNDIQQDITSFKTLFDTLNSRQFMLYQPIRASIKAQLQTAYNAQDLQGIKALMEGLETAFGDILNEQEVI